jgi:hypothetical protein
VSKLARKQPDIRILGDIARNVSNSLRLMLHQLLAQLRYSLVVGSSVGSTGGMFYCQNMENMCIN